MEPGAKRARRSGQASESPFASAQCPEVEQAVLGAMLTDEVACASAVQWLRGEHFGSAKHQAIFEAAFDLFSAGKAVNQITVTMESGLGALDVSGLTMRACMRSQVEQMARIVIEHWMKRQAVSSAFSLIGRVKSGEDIFTILDEHHRTLSEMEVGNAVDTRFALAVAEGLRDAEKWAMGRRDDVVPSGIWKLDTESGGFPVGEVTLLSAMSGAGKTAFLTSIIRYLARRALVLKAEGNDPGAILVFSAEMSRRQIVHRIAQAEAMMNVLRLKLHRASPGEYEKYSRVLGGLADLPIHIDDTPSPSLAYIAARCQQVQHTHGLWLVGIDYDEKQTTGLRERDEQMRVSNIAVGNKNLAKRFKVPFLVLGQYKRESRMWTRIPGDDLVRFSDKKIHESSMVLHWHWPKYWADKGIPHSQIHGYDAGFPDRGMLYCTKNREALPLEIPIDFYPQYMLFKNVDEPRPDGYDPDGYASGAYDPDEYPQPGYAATNGTASNGAAPNAASSNGKLPF